MDTTLGLGLRGIVVGFTIAAAVGPISLLTIRRTIAHGRLYGFVSGLGVATADASYAGVAAFGLTAVASLLVSGRVVLGLVGGLIIVILGIRTIRTRPTGPAEAAERPGLGAAYASIYGLTMTNPMTILAFAAVFAGLGFAAGASTFGEAAVLTLGVLAGSTLWWLVLTSIVAWLRGRISTTALVWINRVSGSALVAFGIVAVASGIAAVGS